MKRGLNISNGILLSSRKTLPELENVTLISDLLKPTVKMQGLKSVQSGLEKIDFLFLKDILELIRIRSVDMPAFNRASSKMFIVFPGRIPVRDSPFHSSAVSFFASFTQ